MQTLNRIPSTILGLTLILIAGVVRIAYLTATDIAGDEPFSIFISQFDIPSIVKHLSSGNNPPLFEILLHFHRLLFGESDFALRLLPATASAFTVLPIFLIGERFFNRTVSLTAAVLFIFSIHHIRFAHEIRVYPFFSLVVAWILYLFLTFIRNPSRPSVILSLAVCNIILLYSHFTSFYILLSEVVSGLIFIPRSKWKYLIYALSITMIGYLPMALTFLLRLEDVAASGTWVAKPGLGEIYGSINLMLNQKLTTLALIVSVGIGFLITWKNNPLGLLRTAVSDKPGMTLVVWFALTYFLMFACSIFFIPMFIDRYILYTSIPLFLICGWLVDLVWKPGKWSWVGVMLICLGSILTSDLNPSNDRDIKAAVNHVKGHMNDSTTVFICPDHFRLAFAYHYEKSWFKYLSYPPSEPTQALDSLLNSKHIYPIHNIESKDLSNVSNVIYFDADSKFVIPDNKNFEVLDSQLELVDSTHFHKIFDVYSFSRTQRINSTRTTE